jgi:hypothetical protein
MLIGPTARAAEVRHEDAICNAMHTWKVPTDESAQAAQIMAGTVDLGTYGTMALAGNPNWKPQGTLDLAGNRYQNSLHWALPLLREGTKPGGQKLTARFMALLRDWVKDHPKDERGGWIDHVQYGGFRLGTWVCAERLLTDPADRQWVANQMKVDLAVQLKHFTTTGANNTMLNSALAAYAAAWEVGTAKQRTEALKNVTTLRPTLLNADGSDVEGAPGYGSYLSQILLRTETVLTARKALSAAGAARSSIDRQGDFLAQATRPDRNIESIGDGALRKIASGIFAADSTATWARTSGKQGIEPTRTYSRWSGGYVFGRSKWVKGRDISSSYYSFRTSTRAPATAHRHRDTTGVTFYSDGVSWIGDPGPYRYDTSALRRFITTRAAHSALIATAALKSTARGVLLPVSPSRAADKTCVRDTAYEAAGIGLTRCVYYLRTIDVLVVQDAVTATDEDAEVNQQWVLPPGVGTAPGTIAGEYRLTGTTTTGLERHARILTAGPATIIAAGPVLGRFGTVYGEQQPGSVIRMPITVPAGTTQQALTVVGAGDRPLSFVRGMSDDGRTTLKVTAGTSTQTVVLPV